LQEAYILLNAEAGKEDVLLRSIRQIPAVYDVVGVYGVYDIIVQVRANQYKEVEEAASKIREMPSVKATFTMLVIQN
jgi:DNA-binding Lrp family transcriptional regulator